MYEFSNALSLIIPTALGSLLTFLFTRKKYKAETTGNEIDNVEKAVKIWRDLSSDIKKQFESDIAKLKEENNVIRLKLDSVLKENHSLKEQMESLEKQLRTTTAENSKLLNQLKKANVNLKEA